MTEQAARLLMTRPEGANSRFLALLSDTVRARVDVINSPLLAIREFGAPAPPDSGFVAIFTSGRAVPFAPAGAGRPAFCVGERTTGVAKAAGWQAHCAGSCAETLVETLSAFPAEKPVVHFCGRHHRGGVVEKLRAAGHRARRIVVYDQVLQPLSKVALGALEAGEPFVIPLFSPRTAAHFASFIREGMVIFPVVMSAAVGAGLPPWAQDVSLVAGAPTARAMAMATEKAILEAGPG